MCDMRGLFGEIGGGLEVPAEEADLAVNVPLQE